MERLTNVCCCVLLLVMVVVLGTVQANLRIEKRDVMEGDADSRSDKFSGLWDPRTGKRKRTSQKSEDYYHSPAVDREQQLADFIDSVDDQWTILALKGGKRDFTPRLGRESGEDMLNAPSTYSGERWYQDTNDMATDMMSQRSPPFAPRLGRHLYIPRLGRKLEKLVVQ